MLRRRPSRKVTYFEPVRPRLVPNTIVESTFGVGRRFSCTMRVDCGQLDPGAVIRPVPGQWRPRMPERLDITSMPAYHMTSMRLMTDALIRVAAFDRYQVLRRSWIDVQHL